MVITQTKAEPELVAMARRVALQNVLCFEQRALVTDLDQPLEMRLSMPVVEDEKLSVFATLVRQYVMEIITARGLPARLDDVKIIFAI